MGSVTGLADRLGSTLFLASLALLLPLLYFDNLIDPVLIPRFLFLAIVLSVSFLVITTRALFGRFRILKRIVTNSPFLFACGYFIISLLSLSWAINPIDGLFESLKAGLFVGMLFISCWIFRLESDRIPTLASLVTICSALLSVVGIFQYFHFPLPGILLFLSQHPTVDGTMGNQNLFASYLLLAFPFIVYGVLVSSGFRHIWHTASAILGFYVILLLQCRAVWVAFAAAGLLTLIVASRYLKWSELSLDQHPFIGKRLVRLVLLLAVALVFSIPTCSRGAAESSMRERVASIVDTKHPTTSGRFDLWKLSLQMIRDRPILGGGAGNWKIEHTQYGMAGTRGESGRSHYQRPHNDFLWICAETGLVGFTCHILIFIVSTIYCFQSIRSAIRVDRKIIYLLMLFGLVAYLVVAFFSYPRERIVHQIYIALFLAIIIAGRSSNNPSADSIPRKAALFVGLFFLSLSIFSAAVGYIRLASESHARRAIIARAEGNHERVVREISRAYTVFYVMDPVATPLLWYRGVALFQLGDRQQAFRDFKESLRIHPYHPHTLNNLATCHELSGEREEAIALYKRALKIYPLFQPALINLAAVYYKEEKYEKAFKILSRCSEKCSDPRMAEYMELIRDKLGDADTANLP